MSFAASMAVRAFVFGDRNCSLSFSSSGHSRRGLPINMTDTLGLRTITTLRRGGRRGTLSESVGVFRPVGFPFFLRFFSLFEGHKQTSTSVIQAASLALASLEASPEALWLEQRREPCQAGGPFGSYGWRSSGQAFRRRVEHKHRKLQREPLTSLVPHFNTYWSFLRLEPGTQNPKEQCLVHKTGSMLRVTGGVYLIWNPFTVKKMSNLCQR